MDAVAYSLEKYISDFEVKIDNLPEVSEDTILKQMDDLQKELIRQEKKLTRLFDAWEDGLIADNEFADRKAINNDRIASIKNQMDHLEESIPVKEDYEEKIMSFHDALGSLLDADLDADIKNAYLKGILDRIEFSRECNSEFILDVFLKED